MEPGPMPTLTASAPASRSATAASRGRDVAGDHVDLGEVLLDPAGHLDHALAVAVRGVDHHHVDMLRGQGLDPLVVARAHRRADAQAVLLVAVVERLDVADQRRTSVKL
jgi:hypothetical protein